MFMRNTRFATILAVAALALPMGAHAQKNAGKVNFTLSSVADSAALAEALAALPGRPEAGWSRYSVHFGSTGVADDVTVMSAPETPFDSAVAVLLREHITKRVTTGVNGFMYVAGTWGPHPVLATYSPTRSRTPQLANRRLIASELEVIGRHFAVLLPGGGVQVVARVRVDAGGVPDRVTLESGTGIADLDRAIIALMRRSRYRPAMLDGRAVRIWVTMPLNIIAPAGGFTPPA